MISLEKCLAERVLRGEVRIEDARATANDSSSLDIHLVKDGPSST